MVGSMAALLLALNMFLLMAPAAFVLVVPNPEFLKSVHWDEIHHTFYAIVAIMIITGICVLIPNRKKANNDS
jgi:hypothetical protein